MPNYLARFDRGHSERFDAVSDAAARDYCVELLSDGLCDDDESVSLYRIDEGGRGDEEFLGEVSLGGDEGDDECFIACDWRDGAP